LAYLFTVSTAPDRLVSQIRLDVNLITSILCISSGILKSVKFGIL
jgi:hypothetical protein